MGISQGEVIGCGTIGDVITQVALQGGMGSSCGKMTRLSWIRRKPPLKGF